MHEYHFFAFLVVFPPNTDQTTQFENFLNRPTTMLNFDFKRNPHCIKTQELQMKRALLIIS